MPKLSMETPHELGQEEATQRLKHGFSFVKGNFQSHLSDVTEEWNDHALKFGFKAMGMKIAGDVVVEESRVKVDASLPMAAIMFKGTIEDRVRKELERLLAK
jgi:hypothetical protein